LPAYQLYGIAGTMSIKLSRAADKGATMNNVKDLPPSLKKLPRRGKLKDIEGKRRKIEIFEECWVQQSDYPDKIITLQKFRWLDEGKIELRLGYWIKAKKKGKYLGKWIWGHYNPHVLPKDFSALLKRARGKGLIGT
jgi:hypothetical protein